MVIRISSKFKKAYKKLPNYVKEKTKEKEKIFRINAFDAGLGSHKLHGKYKDYWAFVVVGQYRIMFAFINKDKIDFINIGTHEIYK